MNITIKNWKKYNPRGNLKSMPWFRVESKIGRARGLFGLSPAQKWFWIFLMAECATDNSDTLDVELDYLAHYSGLPENDVLITLEYLSKKSMIRCTRAADPLHVRDTCVSARNETNERNVTNETNGTRRTNERASMRSIDAPARVMIKKPKQDKAKKAYGLHTLDLAQRWLDYAIKNKPGKNADGWTVEKFAEGLETAKRLAGLADEDLEFAFGFIQVDDDWGSWAACPLHLERKSKRNGMRKIENLLNAMKKNKEYKTAKANAEFLSRQNEPREDVGF